MTTQPDTLTRDDLRNYLTGYTQGVYWNGTQRDMSEDADGMDVDWIDSARDYDELPLHVTAAIHADAIQALLQMRRHNNGHTLATYATARAHQITHPTGDERADGWNLTGYDAAMTAQGAGVGLWDRNIPEGDDLSAELTDTHRTLTLDTATNTYYYE